MGLTASPEDLAALSNNLTPLSALRTSSCGLWSCVSPTHATTMHFSCKVAALD